MKLTKMQISALANSIQSKIAPILQKEYDEKVKAIKLKHERQVISYIETLKKIPENILSNFGYNFDLKHAESKIRSALLHNDPEWISNPQPFVNIVDIEHEIIIATIDSEDVAAIVKKIEEKYLNSTK